MRTNEKAFALAKAYGGRAADYLNLCQWFDEPTNTFQDQRASFLRHTSQGIFEAERKFGHTLKNSDGHMVPVRYIGELHVCLSNGSRIPTIADWLSHIRPQSWMATSSMTHLKKYQTTDVP